MRAFLIMLKRMAWILLAVFAIAFRVTIESGHIVGPLIYLSSKSPMNNSLETLRKLRVLPDHCSFVAGSLQGGDHHFVHYTPPGSEISPDTKISLASASKIVSATVILSVFPNPDQVRIKDVLPMFSIHHLEEHVTNITVRELLSFTSGVRQGTCETQATGWGDCVQDLLEHQYDANKRGKFMYSRSHLTIAAYMAVLRSGKSWDALMRDYVIRPAGIVPAPVWDEPEHSNGEFGFDAPVDFWDLRGQALEEHRKRLKHHPAPASALSGSANQLALFYQALINGSIGGAAAAAAADDDSNVVPAIVEASKNEFRKQLFEPQTPAFGFGLWTHYASGNWRAGRVAHSQGMLGVFPFIAFRGVDVQQQYQPEWFGIFVMDRRRSSLWRSISNIIGIV